MPINVMLKLGDYRFSVDSAAYQSLNRSMSYRWVAQERLTRCPAQQYIGPGAETISLSGIIYPHYKGGLKQLDTMRREAAKGKALHLSDGFGGIHGRWVITQIGETQTVFDVSGAPLKQEFQLQLTHYGKDF